MNLPTLEDRDLFLLLSTQGIRFLSWTYDLVPGNGGFILRILKGADLVAMETLKDEADVVAYLREELEQALYCHILGRHYPAI